MSSSSAPAKISEVTAGIDLSDSPSVAKLHVHTPVVPGALCLLEIHEHARDEVSAPYTLEQAQFLHLIRQVSRSAHFS